MGSFRLFLEYYTNDIVYLKKYLNMSDKDKNYEVASKFAGMFPDFLENTGYDYPIEDEVDIDKLNETDPDVVKAFAKWLMSVSYISAELPTFVHMDYDKDVKNQWLIHFSDNAEGIANDQNFAYGTDTLEELGLTTWKETGVGSKAHPGYNFAYDLNDYKRYGRKETGSGWKYGKHAIIFRASGIKVFHRGDMERQVIFYGPTAKNINLLYLDQDSMWSLTNKKNGKIVYQNEDLTKVVNWFQKNYDQYRKVLN